MRAGAKHAGGRASGRGEGAGGGGRSAGGTGLRRANRNQAEEWANRERKPSSDADKELEAQMEAQVSRHPEVTI